MGNYESQAKRVLALRFGQRRIISIRILKLPRTGHIFSCTSGAIGCYNKRLSDVPWSVSAQVPVAASSRV
jgi:hypothetical protein